LGLNDLQWSLRYPALPVPVESQRIIEASSGSSIHLALIQVLDETIDEVKPLLARL
jgi:hypothetical protein